MNFENYGWIEYVKYDPIVNTREQVASFYRRAGVLLALTDMLNYTDGHYENLIASGVYPVLIDCETLFTNYEKPLSQGIRRTVLFTQLLQTPPKEEELGMMAAFQISEDTGFETSYAYALNDRSDEISVRFRGFNKKPFHNHLILEGVRQNAKLYVDSLLEGFNYASSLAYNVLHFISEDEWYINTIKKMKTRQLMNHTMMYNMLLRTIQQPEYLKNEGDLRDFLIEKLEVNSLAHSEASDLIDNDIPFFWHRPSEADLYDSRNQIYANFFKESALSQVKNHLVEDYLSGDYVNISDGVIRYCLGNSEYPFPNEQ